MSFYGITILPHILANLVLSVETEELGIPAGLQDRVIQAYEGCVYMDFDREHMEKHGFGRYEPLDPTLLPRCYVAYTTRLSEGTEVFHNDIRSRFRRNDPEVVDAMAESFESSSGPLAERLMDALDAAQAAGGDARGMQSGAILVVAPRVNNGYSDRVVEGSPKNSVTAVPIQKW